MPKCFSYQSAIVHVKEEGKEKKSSKCPLEMLKKKLDPHQKLIAYSSASEMSFRLN